MNKTVVINEDKCTGCGACIEMCPQGILYLDLKSGKCRVKDEHKCDKLAGCERVCPEQVIRINK